MIATRPASETRQAEGPLDRRAVHARFARVHEEAGFDRVLIGYYSDAPDGFVIAGDVFAHTERLGVLLAHRPGFVAPTVAARKLASSTSSRRPRRRARDLGRQRRRSAARRRLPRPRRALPPYRRVPRRPARALDSGRPARSRGRVLPLRGRLARGATRATAVPADLLRRILGCRHRRRRPARRRLRALGRAARRLERAHRARARGRGGERALAALQPFAAGRSSARPRRPPGSAPTRCSP